MTSTIHREPGESRGSRRRGISSPLRAVAILGACGALSLGALGFSSAASAAEIDDAIKSVSVPEDTAVGQVFRIDATWRIPDHSQPGDTFTMTLPTKLEAMQTSFELLDPQGAVVATAKLDKDTGVAVVTIGDYVKEHPVNVHGTLFFDVRVDDDVKPGDEILIDFGDAETTIKPGPGEGSADITVTHKYGWSAGGNRNGWSIEIPGPLTNAVLEDFPEDQTIICEDTVIDGTTVDGPVVLSGTREGTARPTNFADHVPQPDITCTPGTGDAEATLSVDLDDIPEGTVYRLEYRTTPDAGVDKVKNSWKLTSSEGNAAGNAEGRVYNAGGTGNGEAGTPTPTPTPTPPPTTPPATTPPATTPPATTPPVETTPPQTSTPPASTTPPRTTTPAATPSTTTAAPVAVTTPPTPGSAPARLPRTGSEVLPLAGIAAGLVALGTGAVAIAGRRRND